MENLILIDAVEKQKTIPNVWFFLVFLFFKSLSCCMLETRPVSVSCRFLLVRFFSSVFQLSCYRIKSLNKGNQVGLYMYIKSSV